MKKIKDKENSNNPDDQSNRESFLKRWSVNKSKSKDTDVLNQVSDLESSETLNNEIAAEEKQIEEELKLTDDELADKYEVINPDKVNSSVDLREILNKNIPDRLKQLALKRLWRIVPLYGEVSELVEYGEDFTDAATVIDNLQTAYVVGKGYLDKVVEKTDKIIETGDKVIDQVENKEILENKKVSKSKENKVTEIDQKDELINQKDQKKLVDEENSDDFVQESPNEKELREAKPLKPSKMVFKKNSN